MRKALVRLILLLALSGACWAGWKYRDQIVTFVEQKSGVADKNLPKPDPETYTVLSDDLEDHRKRLAVAYQTASSDAEKAEILGLFIFLVMMII